MKDRDFLDTNILVYAFDTRNPRKQKIAENILIQAVKNESAILSTQVLGEFYTVITRKIKQPLTPKEALELIEKISVLQILGIDLNMVKRAVKACDTYKISYWDSLIIAAAERGGCNRLVSEDLNSSQKYLGVTAYNPFAE